MSWYALFVQSSKEHLIEDYIGRNCPDIICLIPKRAVTERRCGLIHKTIKTMFPGYIFIRLEGKISFSTYYVIKKIPYLLQMLNYDAKLIRKEFNELKVRNPEEYYDNILMENHHFQDGFFKEVEPEEMSLLERLLDYNQTLESSVVEISDKDVTVVSGPLLGMEHLIKKIDKHKRKAKIGISMLGEEKDIFVDIILPHT